MKPIRTILNVYTLIVCCSFFSCNDLKNDDSIDRPIRNKKDIHIGDKLSDFDLIENRKGTLAFVSSATMSNAYSVKIDNIVYLVAIESIVAIKSEKIIYIEVDDTSFTTSEGLKVGMNLSEIKDRINVTNIYTELGWGKFIKLDNGWNARSSPFHANFFISNFFKRKGTNGL